MLPFFGPVRMFCKSESFLLGRSGVFLGGVCFIDKVLFLG